VSSVLRAAVRRPTLKPKNLKNLKTYFLKTLGFCQPWKPCMHKIIMEVPYRIGLGLMTYHTLTFVTHHESVFSSPPYITLHLASRHRTLPGLNFKECGYHMRSIILDPAVWYSLVLIKTKHLVLSHPLPFIFPLVNTKEASARVENRIIIAGLSNSKQRRALL